MKTSHRSLASMLLSVGAAALTACTVGPDYQRPDVPLTPVFATDAAAIAPPAGNATDDAAWWHGFNDPLLSRVIERVQAQNLDLAQAVARVDQARAAARLSGASLLPTFDADGSASIQHQSQESQVGKIVHALGADRDNHAFTLGVQASWELDIFGGLRRNSEAARAEADAAEASHAALRVSLTAEAADAYLALRGLQARLALAQSQESTEQHLVDLIRLRVGQGISADRELQRAVGELERVRATQPPLRAAIDAQLNRLDVLMGAQSGSYRAELSPMLAQPVPPAPEGSAAPADLMRRRPDLVAAERRLAAANAGIGAAVAEYYPHVSLSGMLGAASLNASTVFTGDAFQAGGLAGLRWRLFDFGRIDAQVAIARGGEAAALAAYRAAVLGATEDVETALSRLVQNRIEAATLERQISVLTTARNQTQTAYEGGVLGLIDVLDADRELLAASDRLAVARADEARATVASFRALGGGWPG